MIHVCIVYSYYIHTHGSRFISCYCYRSWNSHDLESHDNLNYIIIASGSELAIELNLPNFCYISFFIYLFIGLYIYIFQAIRRVRAVSAQHANVG